MMWTIGEIKEKGKAAFRANYWNSVIVAFLLWLLLGAAGAASRSQANASDVQAQIFRMGPLTIRLFIGALFSIGIITLLLRIFLFNPLQVGGYRFFKKNVEEGNAPINIIKEGFSDYGHIFITLLLRDIFLALWACLFIIPGFVKAYSYRMVPYILKDEPQLSPTEVITRSKEMMNGHKWRAFLLDLSFIGWILLDVVTLGIVGILWTNPYMENTHAALYLALSE